MTDFVAAMRANVTPVSLVTTDGPAGFCGVTISAVSSVSAETPLILSHQPGTTASPLLESAIWQAAPALSRRLTPPSQMEPTDIELAGPQPTFDGSMAPLPRPITP